MNPKLLELFNLYKNLRGMEIIVEEVLTMDHYVYNFDKEEASLYIDYCVGKYEREISKIGSLYKNMVVVDEPDLYEVKDEEEVNSDCEYIRDCLIIIGAVKSGIRKSIQEVVTEIKE